MLGSNVLVYVKVLYKLKFILFNGKNLHNVLVIQLGKHGNFGLLIEHAQH